LEEAYRDTLTRNSQFTRPKRTVWYGRAAEIWRFWQASRGSSILCS